MRRFHDRLLIALVAVCAMAVALVARGREAEPVAQTARIITAGAQVRSGPGDSFYLTETLPEDTAVEVYKRRSDGWCAIRPPADSFSWVYAQHVKLSDDGHGEITKADVPSRVGSRLSSHRDAVQVKLHKGEIVHLVGENERDGEWIKISPPAGEFRWMQTKDITFVGTSDDETKESHVQRASHDVTLAAADGPAVELMAPPLAGSTAAAPISPAPLPTTQPAPLPAPQPLPTSAAPISTPAPAATKPAAQDITPISPITPANSGEITQQLSALELRLSRMVAEPTSTWNVESLEQSAEQLLPRANTVEDRQAVKATLAKIDRFAAIQRRATGTAGGAASGATSNGATVQSITADTSKLPGGPYDAVGVLRPVVSKRPGAPPFALVNEQGQVVSFVTPSPDVNLQPYLGRQIGIVGSRGYVPEFRRVHVTASRVTPITDKMVR